MCQEKYLELGKITVSRRILEACNAEKINELISYHQQGYIMLNDGEFIQKLPEKQEEITMNFYPATTGTIIVMTELTGIGMYRTDIYFDDEDEDSQRGYFDWTMRQSMTSPLALGQISCTLGIKDALSMASIAQVIQRHRHYDWGQLHREDWVANDNALIHNERVFSHYLVDEEHVYVITEADRSATTVMLTREY